MTTVAGIERNQIMMTKQKLLDCLDIWEFIEKHPTQRFLFWKYKVEITDAFLADLCRRWNEGLPEEDGIIVYPLQKEDRITVADMKMAKEKRHLLCLI